MAKEWTRRKKEAPHRGAFTVDRMARPDFHYADQASIQAVARRASRLGTAPAQAFALYVS